MRHVPLSPRSLFAAMLVASLSACSDTEAGGGTDTSTPGADGFVLPPSPDAGPGTDGGSGGSGGGDTASGGGGGGTCTPSDRRCEGPVAQTCSASGAWETTSDCGAQGMACSLGACIGACSRDPKLRNNAGCEYWAVDMDNNGQATNAPFAVIVSNLGAVTATVAVTRRDDATSQPVEVLRRDVGPGTLEVLSLPSRNMGAPGVHWAGYRVSSTAPVVAYQFNPLENVGVYSNDASLLLPADTFGTEFIVMSREQVPAQTPFRSNFTVVAAGAQTEVTYTTTGTTQPGGGLPRLFWGESHTVTLEPYQVLNVKSDDMGADLTGTIITANRPVGVFAGHEGAISAPLDEARERYLCCVDHLEHQLYPVATWGTRYIAARSQPRGRAPDYWRILASEDMTQVSFEPSNVHQPVFLSRGEWVDFPSTADFVINATKPVMVGQILASSGEVPRVAPGAWCQGDSMCDAAYTCELGTLPDGSPMDLCTAPACTTAGSTAGCPDAHVCGCSNGRCKCEPLGDPTLIMVPPDSQYRDNYVFLTPNKYAFDYVTIVAPSDATVSLDAQPIDASKFTALGGAWKVARLAVADGVHRVTSDRKVGVVVYGFDEDVSYGYAGGLNLVDR